MLKKLCLLSTAAVLLYSANSHAQTAAANQQPMTEFERCRAANETSDLDVAAACSNAEIKRLDAEVARMLERYLKEETFQKWNNGNGLFRGNFKDMNDAFISYRTRFCSLHAVAHMEMIPSASFNRSECYLELTRDYLSRLQTMFNNYNADLI